MIHQKINEFDKAWKKTCPTCITNPNSILWFKDQCNDCNIKEKSNKKYTDEDMAKLLQYILDDAESILLNNGISYEKIKHLLNKQD